MKWLYLHFSHSYAFICFHILSHMLSYAFICFLIWAHKLSYACICFHVRSYAFIFICYYMNKRSTSTRFYFLSGWVTGDGVFGHMSGNPTFLPFCLHLRRGSAQLLEPYRGGARICRRCGHGNQGGTKGHGPLQYIPRVYLDVYHTRYMSLKVKWLVA